MSAPDLPRCQCGCGRRIPRNWKSAYYSRACRAKAGHCRHCDALASPGFVTCADCRARIQTRRRTQAARDLERLDARYLGAGDVDATFAAAKAALRREWHIDPWAQRSSWGEWFWPGAE